MSLGESFAVVQEPDTAEWKTEQERSVRILGQAYGTFLICETDKGLIFIDQHAAHERLVFEKLKRQRETETLPVVQLLLPLLMDVTAEESFLLSSFSQEFLSLGFEIDSAGEGTYAIRSLPSGVDPEKAADLVREMLSRIAVVPKERRGGGVLDTLLVTLACHTAVRGNFPLRREEIEELVGNLAPFSVATTCPHGRPVFYLLTREELNRQFKRDR
jgi:DNA mismatch repair protein MutL